MSFYTARKGLGGGARGAIILAKREGGTVGYKGKGGRRRYASYATGKRTYLTPRSRYRFNRTDGEMKFFDTDISVANVANAFVAATNQVPTLHIIPQGDTQSTRDGRRVWLKSIHLKFTVTPGTLTSDVRNKFRWILYMDTQCNGAAITGAQLLQNFTVNGYRNIENTQRIKVIKDVSFTIPILSTLEDASVRQNERLVRYNKTCNIPIDWDSTASTGSLATTRSNCIGLIYVATSAADTMDVVGESRVRFTETQY